MFMVSNKNKPVSFTFKTFFEKILSFIYRVNGDER